VKPTRLILCAGLVAVIGAAEPIPVSAPADQAIQVQSPFSAEEIDAYLRRADDMALAEDTHWLVLLHYASGLFGRQSRIDDAKFFLAPHGADDPRAEMQATVRGLLAPSSHDPKVAVAGRYPARCEWLCERLGIDRTRLLVLGDPEFEKAYAALRPRSAVLVFPAAYMNTPASMFGHTMLLVRSGFHSTLLSQAINYAAVTTESNGLIFAIKGIFGMYPGYFSLLPYYQKVKEYTDLDQRDIWEYELTLTEPEIRRMLLHVWEMRSIGSDYFFFDENCSYNLLYLIDAARPGLELHRTGGPWVIPLDTVKAVRHAGLMAECVYRPSRSARVLYIAGLLPSSAALAARDLARGAVTIDQVQAAHTDPVEWARMCELSAEYLQSLRGNQDISQADYQRRLVPILKARSAVPLTADQIGTRQVPPPSRPDHTHGSSRLSLAGGRLGEQAFAEVAYRPAYHDLIDPGEGFLPGAQIEFANLVLRWYEGEERVEVQRFDALRLSSFSDVSYFYTPVSWRINIGVVNEQMGDGGEWHHQAYVDGGAGLAAGIGDGGMFYGIIQADARVYGVDEHHSIGLGPAAGMLIPIGRRWLLNPYAAYTGFVVGDQADNWDIGLNQRFRLTSWCSVAGEVSRRETWDWLATTALVRFQIYF